MATSEGYKTKASAKNGIESVQKNAPDAAVVDGSRGARCPAGRYCREALAA